MTVPQIIDAIRNAGGQIDVDHGDLLLTAARPLPPDLVTKVRNQKPELLAALTRNGLEVWSCLPLDELKRRHVALKIKSDEFGDLWLVSTEVERELADDGTPTYTVAEARKIIGLPKDLTQQIHEFKKDV